MPRLTAISYGGGVQSTALLVLAAQGEIDFPIALFANTGDDSEHPATLRYVREVAGPYAAAHGIDLAWVQRRRRDGTPVTLLGQLESANRSIDIPMRMANGAPGNRNCTVEFKVKPIAKELDRRGATADDPAVLALGISVDEYQRMRDARIPSQRFVYPLIERRLDRAACVAIIKRAGLPIPHKSSCWFCPNFRIGQWQEERTAFPDLFAKAADLETMLNERRATLGKDKVWLSSRCKPLREAVADTGQVGMFEDGASCDIAGYCNA